MKFDKYRISIVIRNMKFMELPFASNTTFLPRRNRVRDFSPSHKFPSVTIFLTFNPKMEKKNKILYSLSRVLREASSQLRLKYPGEMSELVREKLDTIIRNLNFATNTQSLAIFVSPVFEKVYYLGMNVEERVIVNQSLQIRDLVDNKKQLNRFHILLLGKKNSKIFLGSVNGFIDISLEGFVNKIHNESKLIGNLNFQNSAKIDATRIKNYLLHVDQVLNTVLLNDRLPIVVVGDYKLITQFKKITCNDESIAEYVKGDFQDYSFADIEKMLETGIINWQQIRDKCILNQLKVATDHNQLILGIEHIRYEALRSRGGHLILEKEASGYMGKIMEDSIDPMVQKYNKFSNVKNQVDEIIEKVFENGGNVELVDKGFLKSYGPIALIKNIDSSFRLLKKAT